MRLLMFNLATDADDPILGFATHWIAALARRVAFIHVITMRAGRVDVPENVKVYSVGKEKGYSEPHRAVEFYRYLFQILRKDRIDACFAHMIPIFSVLAAPVLKVQCIPITLWYTHKSITPVLRLAEKLVDRVVTASPESFRIPSHKVIVTGHGIDTDIFVPAPTLDDSPNHMFTITSVGRIAPIKRHEMLIEAVRLLIYKYNFKNIKVRLVGNIYSHDISYAEKLKRQVSDAKLTEVVKFVGPVPLEQVVKEYWRADVVVNLSDTDSVDKAVLEAMSCGVLVITSNAAFRSVLGPLAGDLMVPKQNPELLAERVWAISQRPLKKRQALGEKLRRIVIEKHSLQRLVSYLVQEVLKG